MILCRILERFVGLVTALCAEKTQLFFSDIPEELRRSLLTALWTGYEFAHGVGWLAAVASAPVRRTRA